MFKYIKRLYKLNKELLWAQIWNDTIADIPWLQNRCGISVGRWGVGYNYIYVMTRVLESVKPKSVLDVGFGVSSKLVSQYFSYNNFIDGKHIILEHDEDWISFYHKSFSLSSSSKIYVQKLVSKNIGRKIYPAYEDAGKDIKDMRFCVISIDAPFGGGGITQEGTF